MSISTPGDLVNVVLSYSGIISDGQAASSEDANRIFDDMNMYIGTVNNIRFLIYALQSVSFTCTGAQSYTIGEGATIDTPRPDRIQSASLVFLNGTAPAGNIHNTLQIIQSYEDYSQLTLPGLIGPSTSLFYDSQYPYGNIFPYPIPPGGSQYAINLIIKKQIPQFTSLFQQIELPPAYLNALKWVMINRTRGAYGLPVDQAAVGLERAGLQVLRMANSQSSQMVMPAGVLPLRRGLYGNAGFQIAGLS